MRIFDNDMRGLNLLEPDHTPRATEEVPEMVQLVDSMLAKDPANRPSLNAVRTVIKRLRTTTLPTRTQAGLEISLTGLKNQKAPPPEQPLELSPSRVGAQAVLPGDSRAMDDDPARRFSSER